LTILGSGAEPPLGDAGLHLLRRIKTWLKPRSDSGLDCLGVSQRSRCRATYRGRTTTPRVSKRWSKRPLGLIPLPHGGLRPFEHKCICLTKNKLGPLCGASWVTFRSNLEPTKFIDFASLHSSHTTLYSDKCFFSQATDSWLRALRLGLRAWAIGWRVSSSSHPTPVQESHA
jgi:hypothetical protein